jgi:nucleotide-binding universal stress UspA family protein
MQPPAELPVVVGVDGSPSSVLALDLAATEAALREVALRIVYVREPPDRWRTVGRHPAPPVDPHGVIADARHRVAQRRPRLVVESRVVDGLPAVVLIEQSVAAVLTVVGYQGGGVLGQVAGSVCRRLATHGHGAVMVARGPAAIPEDAPVVLGVDVSAPDGRAIEFAFAAAAVRRAPLRAVYASCGPATEQALRQLAETLAGWSERYPDVKVECVTDDRLDPPAAVLATALDAQRVVVGSHDQTAHRGLVLGRVGDTLLRHAPCPVAVVHA